MTLEYPAAVPADRHEIRSDSPQAHRLAARRPFEAIDLDSQFDPITDTLWTYMRQRSRPSFNPGLLAEFRQWQDDIVTAQSSGSMPIRRLSRQLFF